MDRPVEQVVGLLAELRPHLVDSHLRERVAGEVVELRGQRVRYRMVAQVVPHHQSRLSAAVAGSVRAATDSARPSTAQASACSGGTQAESVATCTASCTIVLSSHSAVSSRIERIDHHPGVPVLQLVSADARVGELVGDGLEVGRVGRQVDDEASPPLVGAGQAGLGHDRGGAVEPLGPQPAGRLVRDRS